MTTLMFLLLLGYVLALISGSFALNMYDRYVGEDNRKELFVKVQFWYSAIIVGFSALMLIYVTLRRGAGFQFKN